MKHPKFNFIPETQLKTLLAPAKSYARYSPTSSQLVICATNDDIGNYRGRFVRLFADAKAKSVAWQFMDREPMASEGKQWVRFGDKVCSVYLGKAITDALGIKREKGTRYEQMEIRTYRDQSMLGSDKPFYYVTFSKKQ